VGSNPTLSARIILSKIIPLSFQTKNLVRTYPDIDQMSLGFCGVHD